VSVTTTGNSNDTTLYSPPSATTRTIRALAVNDRVELRDVYSTNGRIVNVAPSPLELWGTDVEDVSHVLREAALALTEPLLTTQDVPVTPPNPAGFSVDELFVVLYILRDLYNEQGLKDYLTSPNPDFGGRSPLTALAAGEGYVVLATIHAHAAALDLIDPAKPGPAGEVG
jgi:hypothetical protein